MAAEPVHVEVDDEVPTIIERIRRSPADEVHLVVPPHARFGQSRFNFQLLKQYATRLGKRVAIWSPDPVVQRLAAESGFETFQPRPAASNGQPGSPYPRRDGRQAPDQAGAPQPAAPWGL